MTRLRIRVFFAALLLCCATSHDARAEQAAADDEAAGEPATTLRERIVVTANRLESTAREVGSSVTVITAEEIELSAKTTVAEVLRTVPGLEVVRGGGPGQITSVFIRGGSSSHTLVLLDGVRVNNAATGAYDFANLTTDHVERIEIVRGPQSTLYGSEAISGVVSITTRQGGADGVRVDALGEAGNLGLGRFRVGVDGAAGGFDYALAVSDESLDGVSSASERRGNTEDDPYELTSASARLGFGFAGDGRADLTLRTFDAEVGNDGFDFVVGPVDDLDRVQTREGSAGSLRVKKAFGERLSQTFLVGWNDEELAGRDPGDAFSNFTVESRTFELSAQSDVTLSDSDVLTVGFAYDERQGGSVGSFDERVDLVSAFVQNAWSWRQRLHLTAGARLDDHSEFGSEATWRLAASFDATSETRLHGSFGTGFKAPTLNDLFFPFFSNPDLSPETSEGFDLGVEHTFGDGRVVVDLTWFDLDFDDLIAFSFATFRPENISRATSSGLELTLEVRPSETLHLVASHTWNDTEDAVTGAQLPRRPEHRTTLHLYLHPLPRWKAALSAIAVHERIDSDGSGLDDYERVDLSLRYRASDSFEPYLRVENLFDEDYEEIRGFTTPGVVAAVGLKWTY